MSSISTIKRDFRGTVNLKKIDKPKFLLTPAENYKADLGTRNRKFRNVYITNPLKSKDFSTGTWTPNLFFFSEQFSRLTPLSGADVPSFTVHAADYQKSGSQVIIDVGYRITVNSPPQEIRIVSALKLTDLPFPFHQRTKLLLARVRETQRAEVGTYFGFYYIYNRYVRVVGVPDAIRGGDNFVLKFNNIKYIPLQVFLTETRTKTHDKYVRILYLTSNTA